MIHGMDVLAAHGNPDAQLYQTARRLLAEYIALAVQSNQPVMLSMVHLDFHEMWGQHHNTIWRCSIYFQIGNTVHFLEFEALISARLKIYFGRSTR